MSHVRERRVMCPTQSEDGSSHCLQATASNSCHFHAMAIKQREAGQPSSAHLELHDVVVAAGAQDGDLPPEVLSWHVVLWEGVKRQLWCRLGGRFVVCACHGNHGHQQAAQPSCINNSIAAGQDTQGHPKTGRQVLAHPPTHPPTHLGLEDLDRHGVQAVQEGLVHLAISSRTELHQVAILPAAEHDVSLAGG